MLFGLFLLSLSLVQISNAESWNTDKTTERNSGVEIPADEFTSYFDSNGVYTVIGVVKNYEDAPIIPTITITIYEGDKTISKSFEYVPILPSKELPFKIKFLEITSISPVLGTPTVSYVYTEKQPLDIAVLYDDTLIQHEDGHLTGRIINNGNSTVYNIKIFAIIHGYDKILDMGQNVEMIQKLEPGEIRNFSMYPDPSVTEEISYYSCFAPTDVSVVPMYAQRKGEKFYFRYDSGSWYYDAKFNEEGTELSMKTQTSFNLETYTIFEFPYYDDNEKFEVYLNGHLKESIQSQDEYGNWHVSFKVAPRETGEILITGFARDWEPKKEQIIPDWIRNNAMRWSQGNLVDDVFVRGLQFLIKEDLIKGPTFESEEKKSIPEWVKISTSWWVEGKIDDDTFVQGIEYLISRGIIRV